MNVILVVGARRSGTTLLNQILCNAPDTNPHIGEAQLLTRLCGTYRWAKNNYERVVQWYFADEDECCAFFQKVVRELLSKTAEKYSGVSNIVLKNPEFSNFKKELDELLPDARQIICIRDPRDQIVSELDVGERQVKKGVDGNAAKAFKSRDIKGLAEKFNQYYVNIAKGRRDNILFVRYEDVIRDLVSTLKKIESFAGINLDEYNPEKPWVNFMHENHIKKMPAYVEQYGAPIDKSRIGRYQDVLSEEEEETVLDVCAELFAEYYS